MSSPDGVLTPTYEWTVGTTSIGTGSTYTVSSADTNVGATIAMGFVLISAGIDPLIHNHLIGFRLKGMHLFALQERWA